MRPELVLRGVIPANLMAFDSELEIDEENYRRHLRYLLDTPGVTGITTNAHASEVATLTFEEQQRVLEITLDEVIWGRTRRLRRLPGRNEQGGKDR